MTQWVKPLSHRCEDLGISRIHIEPDVLVNVVSNSTPAGRWEVETAESQEASGPASLAYREQMKRYLKTWKVRISA